MRSEERGARSDWTKDKVSDKPSDCQVLGSLSTWLLHVTVGFCRCTAQFRLFSEIPRCATWLHCSSPQPPTCRHLFSKKKKERKDKNTVGFLVFSCSGEQCRLFRRGCTALSGCGREFCVTFGPWHVEQSRQQHAKNSIRACSPPSVHLRIKTILSAS